MPMYNYITKDKEGKAVKGIIEAADKYEAIKMLRDKGLVIINVTEAAQIASIFSGTFFKQKVKLDDLVIFSRQMATMVSAGITLISALDILSEQMENKAFKEVLIDVRKEIESGKSLSEGFAKHSGVFSNIFVNMVKAGESSGMLDEILDRVALYLEKTNTLQKKIKSAMVYPAVITVMALSVTILLLIKVIPIFGEIYAGFGADLPLPTQILISASEILRRYFLIFVVAFSIIAFMFGRFAKTPRGKLFVDRRFLRLPIFGALVRKVAISKFTRTLSTLIKAGVPILTCLEIVAKTSGNMVVENAVTDVRNSIREGESIATPLKRCGVFPPLVVRMISVGEKTGELDKMLSKISDFYDEQIDASVSGLTSMIEPLIIAFLGIVIGAIVICMFLPIFQLSQIVTG
ncbi:MAG: type II secretion system F family protein [Candidatus Omnitrophica bacterium]|nr:type II secretion system F family protein [Candidatus Omnitrophota bacterium]